MRYVSSGAVLSALTPRDAVDALRKVLKGGFDPATDPHRQKVALPHGEMHLLPSALDEVVGVKVLGIQPARSQVDASLLQGSYLLMGAAHAGGRDECRSADGHSGACGGCCGVLDRLRRRVNRWSASSSARVRRGGCTHARLWMCLQGAGGAGDVYVET